MSLLLSGDVYVFQGDEIIGVAGGVRFQCVPKTLLDTLLSPAKSKAASTYYLKILVILEDVSEALIDLPTLIMRWIEFDA